MSTNALIGRADTDAKAATLTYLNWDGYPTAVLPTLRDIATARGGLGAALDAILSYAGGWGYLDAAVVDYAALDILDEWANAEIGTVERSAHMWKHSLHQGSEPVPGIGILWPVKGSPSEERFEGAALKSVGRRFEWAYVVDGDTLHVLWGPGDQPFRDMASVASFTLDELSAASEQDFLDIRVGPNLDRDALMVWAVFPDVPEESRHLSARQWAGLDPIGAREATAVEYSDGRRVTLRRSYSEQNRVRRWSAVDEAGEPFELEVRVSASGQPIPPFGARFILPRTRADFEALTAASSSL